MQDPVRSLQPRAKKPDQDSTYSKKSSWKKILFLFLLFAAIVVGCVLFPPAGIVLLGLAISKVAIVIMGAVAFLVLWVLFLRVGSSRRHEETPRSDINQELAKPASDRYKLGEEKGRFLIENQFKAAFKKALDCTDLEGYDDALAMLKALLISNEISLVDIYEESRTYLDAALKVGFPRLTQCLLNYLVSKKLTEDGFFVPVHSIEDLEKAVNIIDTFLKEYEGPQDITSIQEKLREIRKIIFAHYFDPAKEEKSLSDKQKEKLNELLEIQDLELLKAALNSFLFVPIIQASDDGNEDVEEVKEVYSFTSKYQTGFLKEVNDIVAGFFSSSPPLSIYANFLFKFCNSIEGILTERRETDFLRVVLRVPSPGRKKGDREDKSGEEPKALDYRNIYENLGSDGEEEEEEERGLSGRRDTDTPDSFISTESAGKGGNFFGNYIYNENGSERCGPPLGSEDEGDLTQDESERNEIIEGGGFPGLFDLIR